MQTVQEHASETAPAGSASLRLAHPIPIPRNQGLLSTGIEITCDLREIAHPEGRFQRADGTRYDICVMEVRHIPDLRPPAVARANFIGDCADNQPAVIRLGNVRQSSFRLQLISPGAALGTLAAAAKSAARGAI